MKEVGIAMNNSLGQGQRLSSVNFYDKIETYLRSLNVLGVSTENYASIPYPLVKSAMSSDISKLWERHLGSLTISGEEEDQGTIKTLDKLLKYLQTDLEFLQKIKLAKSEFSFDKDGLVNKQIRLERKEKFTHLIQRLTSITGVKKNQNNKVFFLKKNTIVKIVKHFGK